jgi:uncharacterized heparinase superfamily protein
VSNADLANRIRRRVQKVYARARHRLGLGDVNPGPASLKRAFRHPIDAANRDALVALYHERFAAAIEPELAEARRLLEHRFTFLGHTWEPRERIAWSLDPASSRDWSQGFSPDIVYRGPARLGDVKLPWELSKHQYFFTLGKAAWLSGDAAFADEIVREIDDWIAGNPYNHGVHWISALESGARVVSWILTFPFWADRADSAFLDRMARSIAQHMVFVESHLSTGPFANNHLIADAAALVVGGLFLESPHSARWVATGLKHLEEQMVRQVTPDGAHVELSVAYHRFVLDQYHLVNRLLAVNGRAFSSETMGGMERMSAFLMDMLFPDGTAPTFGDGDDARGLWFRADSPRDFRGPLAIGAVLFGRGDFKAQSKALAEDVLWLFGPAGVEQYDRLESRLPSHTSRACPDAGYYIARGGWTDESPVLVADCGPVGFGPAGHGHADALSCQLFAAGYAFLVDPGPFSYNQDYAWRDAFRLTRAHNTVTIDATDQSVPADRMAWRLKAKARVRLWESTPWLDLLDGEHDGYHRLPQPVTHRRIIAYLKPDVWIVVDHVTGSGDHRLELLWHFAPDCAVVIDGNDRTVLQSPAGDRLYLAMHDQHHTPVRPTILIGTNEERAAWYSASYGTRVASRALSVRRDFTGECLLVTSLTLSESSATVVGREGNIISCRVRRGGDIEDTLRYPLSGDTPFRFERRERGTVVSTYPPHP